MCFPNAVVFFLLAITLAAGCSRRPVGVSPAPRQSPEHGSITLYAPCGLIGPFYDASEAFKAENPGVEILTKFDTDVALLKEVEKGERPDLFVSPGGREAEVLEGKGLIKEKVALGSYAIVVTVPRGNPGRVQKVSDLAGRQVRRIAMPDPERNSVGYFARQSLTRLGLWEAVEKKAKFTERAMDAHKMVMQGEAEAGFSFKTCPLETDPKRLEASRIQVALELPTGSYDVPRVVIALLSTAKNPALAREFLFFLTSKQGTEMLLRAGLPDEQGLSEAVARARGVREGVPEEPGKGEARVVIRAFYPHNERHKPILDLVRSFEAKYPGKVKVFTFETNDPQGKPKDFAEWRKSGLDCGGITINGKDICEVTLGGKTYLVTFHRAMGGEWKAEELEAAVRQEVERIYGTLK